MSAEFASNIQDKVFAFINSVDKELEKYPLLKKLESQSGVPKSYGTLGFVFVYFFLIFLNFGGIGQLLSNFASLVIPGYYSLQALETKNVEDDTQFLTYWVVYAAFTVVEFWSKTILYWVPFYWVFKTVFFIYISLPQYGGAKYIYLNFLRPVSVKFLGISGKPVSTPAAFSSTSAHLKEQIDEVTADIGSSTSVHL